MVQLFLSDRRVMSMPRLVGRRVRRCEQSRPCSQGQPGIISVRLINIELTRAQRCVAAGVSRLEQKIDLVGRKRIQASAHCRRANRLIAAQCQSVNNAVIRNWGLDAPKRRLRWPALCKPNRIRLREFSACCCTNASVLYNCPIHLPVGEPSSDVFLPALLTRMVRQRRHTRSRPRLS